MWLILALVSVALLVAGWACLQAGEIYELKKELRELNQEDK